MPTAPFFVSIVLVLVLARARRFDRTRGCFILQVQQPAPTTVDPREALSLHQWAVAALLRLGLLPAHRALPRFAMSLAYGHSGGDGSFVSHFNQHVWHSIMSACWTWRQSGAHFSHNEVPSTPMMTSDTRQGGHGGQPNNPRPSKSSLVNPCASMSRFSRRDLSTWPMNRDIFIAPYHASPEPWPLASPGLSRMASPDPWRRLHVRRSGLWPLASPELSPLASWHPPFGPLAPIWP